MSYINEAFKQFNLLEETDDMFLNSAGVDTLDSFLSQSLNDEDVTDVYDLEAEAEDELKQSYIGKVVCECSVCHSNIFKNKDEITFDEDTGLANIDEECPYCLSTEGYTVIGEITPFNKETEEEPVEDEPELDDIADEPLEVEDEEQLEESLDASGVDKLSGVEELDGEEGLGSSEKLEPSEKISGDLKEALEIYDDNDRDFTEILLDIAQDIDANPDYSVIQGSSQPESKVVEVEPNEYSISFCAADDTFVPDADVKAYGDKLLDYYTDEFMSWPISISATTEITAHAEPTLLYSLIFKIKDHSLTESIEDVTITTEDETMTMTTKEDGGVAIETTPLEEEKEINPIDDEMIAPISDDTEEEILSDDTDIEEEPIDFDTPIEDDSEDVDFDEFDEDSFDSLGESYLRRTYDNISSFKTTGVQVNENLLNVDGVITFKSGAQKKTNFVFEATKSNKNKYIFEGYNAQINESKKAFKLSCSSDNNKLIPESMRYNYSVKNSLNESVKITGRVKK